MSFHCASKWGVVRRDKLQLNYNKLRLQELAYAYIELFNCSIIIWIYKKLLKEQLVSVRLIHFKLQNVFPKSVPFFVYAITKKYSMHSSIVAINETQITIEQLNTLTCIF
jgi:hypothetical protein